MSRAPFPPYPPYPPSASFPPFAPYPPYPAYPSSGVFSPGTAPSRQGLPPVTPGTPGQPPSVSPPPPPPTVTGVSPPPPPVVTPPPRISPYPISSIPLGPVAGWHPGTGYHEWSQLIVDPNSVPFRGHLRFLTAGVHVTSMLYQIGENMVPNWFGVAVPNGIVDFTKPNIFFHPIPAQAGYKDSDYPTKTGFWPELFYYMNRLGSQVDAAIGMYGAPRNQIVVMPFLTSAATDAGILPANWFGIVTNILSDVRFRIAGTGGSPVPISEVVVSSYSVGLVYSDAFRKHAPGLGAYLKQVWDFDGYPKTLSTSLLATAGIAVVKYDQAVEPESYHVPLGRWVDYPNPPPNTADPPAPSHGSTIHHLIRDFMFLSAATFR